MKKNLLLLIPLFIIISSCKKDKNTTCNYDTHKINELQYLASHNSYRIKTNPAIFDFVIGLYDTGLIPDGLNPNEWDYNHVSIPEQMEDYHLRSFEIDVYYDPDGGRFYNRGGNTLVGQSSESNIPELLEPGYKVMHIPDVDYNTHYYTFKQVLNMFKNWSAENPSHEPIFVMIELKAETPADYLPGLGFASALPYTPEAIEDLESEINDIYGTSLEKVYTPDMLRGSYNTLNQAIRNNNWPTLAEAKGHIFFILDGNSEGINNYLDGHPSLEGRAMFTFSDEGLDEAAFIKYDNPVSDQSTIQNLVSEGYMIRTRADSGTTEARTGDTERREAAFSSGAHLISTDYYQPDERHSTSNEWTDYFVELPNRGAIIKNSVSSDAEDCPY